MRTGSWGQRCVVHRPSESEEAETRPRGRGGKRQKHGKVVDPRAPDLKSSGKGKGKKALNGRGVILVGDKYGEKKVASAARALTAVTERNSIRGTRRSRMGRRVRRGGPQGPLTWRSRGHTPPFQRVARPSKVIHRHRGAAAFWSDPRVEGNRAALAGVSRALRLQGGLLVGRLPARRDASTEQEGAPGPPPGPIEGRRRLAAPPAGNAAVGPF